ncbi:hypothetical protein T07_2126 [Trichinella nelsoni]|uniref:Uncharacterized protein n=1 Tax=Trichinella nelsoni TaxID=6336 RepID=A0A0V0SNV8_9BILA|nr:hypothetical protein T07_2126 [Trichinella nelsoni]
MKLQYHVSDILLNHEKHFSSIEFACSLNCSQLSNIFLFLDGKFFIVSVFIGHSAMRYASYIIHILVYNVSECHLHCQFLNVSA